DGFSAAGAGAELPARGPPGAGAVAGGARVRFAARHARQPEPAALRRPEGVRARQLHQDPAKLVMRARLRWLCQGPRTPKGTVGRGLSATHATNPGRKSPSRTGIMRCIARDTHTTPSTPTSGSSPRGSRIGSIHSAGRGAGDWSDSSSGGVSPLDESGPTW